MANKELDIRPLIKDFNKRRNTLPKKLGNGAVKFFRANFDRGGFLDRTISRWKARKTRARGGPKKTLQVSGALKRSIKVINKNRNVVKIGTVGVEYAEIHNTGGVIQHPGGTPYYLRGGKAIFVRKTTAERIFKITGRSLPKTKPHPITIPQRQYIGKSFALEKSLRRKIEKEFSIFAKTQR